MAGAGAARILPDAELTPQRLREETDAVLRDREPMSQAALALAKPDAARDIAHEILATVTDEKVHPSG
jgi:UDP-N-acetylglucosamine--N-acetylmuramyl-(pentapeptide) pyrophosphoryl-undecaprenol N-acetylglucosamine transferase